MTHKVYKPGERNKTQWVGRIIVNGKRTEHILTGCKNFTEAEIRCMELEVDRRKTEATEEVGAEITFRQAAYMYASRRRKLDLDIENLRLLAEHPRGEVRRMRNLIDKTKLGDMSVKDIKVKDLEEAAETLHPTGKKGGTPQTQNRDIMRPAAAILHYAAENGYCPWLRVKLFTEPEPVTRTVTAAVEAKLMDAPLTDWQRLLIMWLFLHGRRITETLRLTWDDIDLNGINGPTYRFYNFKDHGGVSKDVPFDPEVFEALVNLVPQDQRHGRLWPWSHRGSVSWWLKPLTQRLGIRFTCHMARHTMGARLNASGQSLKTIMDTMGHKSAKSSLRYQSTDFDGVRAAMEAAKQFRRKAS